MSPATRHFAAVIALGLATVVAVLAALASGPLGVAVPDLVLALWGRGPEVAELALALRGPRVLTALIAGGGLAASGAAFQILFRNPLAAPDLLGVSSGAGLGAAVALLFGAAAIVVQGAAFAGGLAAAGLAVGCAAMARSAEPRLALVLCGVVIGALASAGLALVLILADPYSQLPGVTYWLLGSFSRADPGEALIALVPAGLGLAALFGLGFRMDALSLGDDQARALGLPAARLRVIGVAAAALLTSAAVSIAGVVGWIGLLAPHAARRLVGPSANRLLPVSVLIGALAALLIDRLATVAGPAELPVGLIAAALGAPLFLILFVLTSRRRP